MPLESTFQDLSAQLRTLRDALLGLRVTVVEDKPLQGDVVLVDMFGDAADDLLGWLEEALAAAENGQQATEQRIDLDRARRALTTCQERFNRIAQCFSSDLTSYERITELKRLGHRRHGEWLAWANSVKGAVDQCKQPLYEVNQALFLCWQEMTERVGMTSVSMQSTTIGQQIRYLKAKPSCEGGSLET